MSRHPASPPQFPKGGAVVDLSVFGILGEPDAVLIASLSPLWAAVLSGDDTFIAATPIDILSGQRGTVCRESILHFACLCDASLEIVQWIVDMLPVGALNEPVPEGPYRGFTALHFAVLLGNESAVLLLIQKGANTNIKTYSQETDICDNDDDADNGSLSFSGLTSLHLAVLAPNISLNIVRTLIENSYSPADLSAIDSHRNNILHSISMRPDFCHTLIQLMHKREDIISASEIKAESDSLLKVFIYIRNLCFSKTDLHKRRNSVNMTPLQSALIHHEQINPEHIFIHKSNQAALFEDNNMWQAAHRGDLELLKHFATQELHIGGVPVGLRGNMERGGEGESILHLSVLLGHVHMVPWVLEAFPSLVNEVYLKYKYQGESVLHLAVVKKQFDIVEMLVEHGAYVNSKVFPMGTEFQPENGNGSLYYGQTVLQFAVADTKHTLSTSKSILRYLVENPYDPADLAAQDSRGNNVLHIMAWHGDVDHAAYAYLRARNTSAMKKGLTMVDITRVRNAQGLTPFLVAIQRGHASIIETLKETRWEFGPNRQIAVCIDDLEPLQPQNEYLEGEGGVVSIVKRVRTSLSAVELAVANGHRDIIASPVFDSILRLKWKLYARRKFLSYAVIMLVVVILFTAALALQPASMEARRSYWSSMSEDGATMGGEMSNFPDLPVNGTASISEVVINYHPKSRLTLEILTLITSAFVLVRPFVIGKLLVSPLEMLFSITVFIIPIARFSIFSASPITALHIENVAFGLASIMGWSFMFSFAKGFEKLGPLVVIFKKILMEDLLQWLWLYFALTAGFAGAFFLQMQSVPADTIKETIHVYDWDTLQGSAVWTVRFIFAQATYDDFRKAVLPWYTQSLFLLYAFLTIILLLNVLIAKLVETFKAVHRDSERIWKVQLAQLIVDIDGRLTQSERDFYLKRLGIWDGLDDDDEGAEVEGIGARTKVSKKRGSVHVRSRYVLLNERAQHGSSQSASEKVMRMIVARDKQGSYIEFDAGQGYWHYWIRDIVPLFNPIKFLQSLQMELNRREGLLDAGVVDADAGKGVGADRDYWRQWDGAQQTIDPEEHDAVTRFKMKAIKFLRRKVSEQAGEKDAKTDSDMKVGIMLGKENV
ncbi:hypothetical protein BC830DRAFT_1141440 [Chytriomyces sp. MP71]|nr:hypothetical protein BC830DRAFT_1141440 [Chytriomyces sp. MP71]